MSVSLEFEPQQLDQVLPQFEMTDRWLLPKPECVKEENIAYNPSGIWTIPRGQPGAGLDIGLVRDEPNRSNPDTSHLGYAKCRPFRYINLGKDNPHVEPFEHALTLDGEDPQLTQINRKVGRKIEKVWGVTVVDAQPKPGQPDQVGSIVTRIYAGKTLDRLEQIAEGPSWMKDIRIAQAGDPLSSTALHVYGRPQDQHLGIHNGNANYLMVDDISSLTPDKIAQAPFMDENLWRVGSGVWGGVNDIFPYDSSSNLLATHRAWNTDSVGKVRHYEAVLYHHNFIERSIRELGVIATADMFPDGTVKDDAAVDLHDVVFTGGGYNGRLEYLTFGVRDGMIGLGKIVQTEKNMQDHEKRHLSLVAGE